MTSINNLMSSTSTSSTSSIYGNRNVISGLASGMDTETMIENAVSGYKTKITSLQQKQEQVQWKQEAYRSIIDKMVNLTRKYTSYTSSTNLFSQSFFNKAVNSVTNGPNKDMVSATGKTSSDIQINGIKQLAQAARRTMGVEGTALSSAVAQTNSAGRLELNGQTFDLSGITEVSKIAGGMTLKYGSSSVYLNFDEMETFKSDPEGTEGGKTAAEKLADAINKKLSETQVKAGSGSYVTASDRILAKADKDGNITFEDKANAGNSIAITSATEDMQSALGFKAGDTAYSMKVNEDKLVETMDTAEYLSDKEISFTLDGVTKTVSLGKLDSSTTIQDIKNTLQTSLDKQFGKGKVQVDFNTEDGSGGKKGGLTFDVANGSTLAVTSEVGTALGLGENGLSTYLDTSKTLKELGVSDKLFGDTSTTQEASVNLSDLIKLSGEKLTIDVGGEKKEINLGEISYSATAEDVAKRINAQLEGTGITVSADGKTKLSFSANADTNFTISSSNNKKADIYTESKGMQELFVNGTSVGKFSEDSTLTSVMNAINNSDTGVKISYSKLTNEFSMVAKDTGAQSQVEMSGNLAEMFGFTKNDAGETVFDEKGVGTDIQGQDAIFTATINGKQMDLTRSSNTVDMDGMTVTLQGAFGNYTEEVDASGNKVYKFDKANNLDSDKVTFTTTADTATIVDAIKSFVNDYNEMIKEIHDAYSTQPNEKSSTDHSRYMPLTEDDKNSMSESAIAAYEEKAKQGILFGSTELSNLYRQMTSAIQNTSLASADMKAIGLSISYSNGLTTLELDESKLTEALQSDPDKVRDVFAKSGEADEGNDGLMSNIKTVLDAYANTSSGSMGILIQQAGSSYSPSSINSNYLQSQYDEFTSQIEKWQEKMSDKVDYYTRQFTALEQLVAQMNNQSSMLAGLQGGY